MTVPPSLFDPLAEQSAVITGLKKFALYNITVLCFTDPGDGERSNPIEVRTSEDGQLLLCLKNKKIIFYCEQSISIHCVLLIFIL